MSAPTWPQGTGRHLFDTLDSTNEKARRMAAAGERGPLWIMARTQTAGRGRRGRAWVSPPGNLMATHLSRPDATPEAASRLSFAAALAVADVLAPALPPRAVRLKWPNDVLIHGRKVAGILLESATAPDGALAWLAIGIGINLAHSPPGEGMTLEPTSLARETGAPAPEPDTALLHLAAALATWLDVWRAQGFGAIRTAWLDRAAGLGEALTARLGTETLTGRFAGLSAEGALELALPGGLTRRITAGEVFLAGTPGPAEAGGGDAPRD